MNKSYIVVVVVLVLLLLGITFIDTGTKPQIDESLVSIFEDRLITIGVERVGQPIEGFDAFMLTQAFPKLEAEDFDGVET